MDTLVTGIVVHISVLRVGNLMGGDGGGGADELPTFHHPMNSSRPVSSVCSCEKISTSDASNGSAVVVPAKGHDGAVSAGGSDAVMAFGEPAKGAGTAGQSTAERRSGRRCHYDAAAIGMRAGPHW